MAHGYTTPVVSSHSGAANSFHSIVGELQRNTKNPKDKLIQGTHANQPYSGSLIGSLLNWRKSSFLPIHQFGTFIRRLWQIRILFSLQNGFQWWLCCIGFFYTIGRNFSTEEMPFVFSRPDPIKGCKDQQVKVIL